MCFLFLFDPILHFTHSDVVKVTILSTAHSGVPGGEPWIDIDCNREEIAKCITHRSWKSYKAHFQGPQGADRVWAAGPGAHAFIRALG